MRRVAAGSSAGAAGNGFGRLRCARRATYRGGRCDLREGDASRRVTYGELVAGKKFNVTLTGNNIGSVTGQAKVKTVQELKYTGQSPERDDIPGKVDGTIEVGRGREAPRHGARAQRKASVRVRAS